MRAKFLFFTAIVLAVSLDVFAADRSADKQSAKDSVWQSQKNGVNFLLATKTADYKDLGPLETVTTFEGPSGLFKITSLPEWDFNRVYVQVEPTDGRELSGYLYTSEQHSKVSGWSISIPVNIKIDFPVFFELAFPEYRKVKLKWWAVMEPPQEKSISLTEQKISGDSVEATYTFGSSTKQKVNLKFRKSDFVDGKIPVVKKFDFSPSGALRLDSLKSYGEIGDAYNIHAELKNNDTITFALPLDFYYNPKADSIVLLHQVNGKWINVPTDSVVNGFVYFRTNSFSLWIERKFLRNWFTDFWHTVGCGVAGSSAGGAVGFPSMGTIATFAASEDCRDAAGNALEPVKEAKTALDFFYDKLREIGIDIVCMDKNGLKNIFGDEEDEENTWPSIAAGSLGFNSLWPGNDPGFEDIYKKTITRMNDPLQKLEVCKDNENVEVCEWEKTRDNLDILLADVIIAQRPGDGLKPKGPSRNYKQAYYDTKVEQFILKNHLDEKFLFKDYFKMNSSFIEQSGWLVKGLRDCLGIFNADGIVIQKWIDFTNSFKNYTSACQAFFRAADFLETSREVLDNAINCAEFLPQNIWRENSMLSMLDGKDEKLIAVSEVMVRVSLLAWLDKTILRDFLLFAYKRAYDGMRDWLELADPFLFSNNIIAKASASLALYEYIFTGKSTNLDLLNASLKKHYGENGGYSEGMGYSQYIWDDVPYVLSALKDAYASNDQTLKIEEKFLKSPDYVFEFSRPVGIENGPYYGRIPVEIDDGCTYNPDYRVWAKLTDNPKYLNMNRQAPVVDDQKKNVLAAFGFPNLAKYAEQQVYGIKLPNRGKLWGGNKDGLLMITAVNGDNPNADTIALSMVAEKGDLWKNGQAHDQQDNLSITLTSNKKGFIIQDRGYTGFGERTNKNFHRYKNHNVVLPEGKTQDDNPTINDDELRSRIENFTGIFMGVAQTTAQFLFQIIYDIALYFDKAGNRYDFAVAGGVEASVEEHVIEKENKDYPEEGVFGYTATTSFGKIGEKPTDPEEEDNRDTRVNHRSILYFGGSFWVIDRANVSDLTWLANSPIDKWDDLNKIYHLHLYGSSEIDASKMTVDEKPIEQHASRTDYPDKQMINYSYSVRDENTSTFVMTYAVEDDFFKTTRNCPKSCQCFENSTKDKRLIVPPLGLAFKICDALPKNECTDANNGKSSAITMFIKNPVNEWISGDDMILDGKLTKMENNVEVEVSLIAVSRTSARYVTQDGSTVSRKHRSTHLPANIILLRQ